MYHPMFILCCQGKGIGSAGGGCLSPIVIQVVVVLMVGLVACVEHSWPVVGGEWCIIIVVPHCGVLASSS